MNNKILCLSYIHLKKKFFLNNPNVHVIIWTAVVGMKLWEWIAPTVGGISVSQLKNLFHFSDIIGDNDPFAGIFFLQN